MAETVDYKYRAFISYSHADTSWAKWLHRGLEGFRIDNDLVGRETATCTIPKSLRPIFRDRDDFTAGHTLSEQTLAALDASHSLIVICSPASAKSHYVTEEIGLFKSRHPERPVIPLIVDGKPHDPELECFPPSLQFKLDAQGQITDEPIEVLAADAREEGDGKHLAQAKVVAGLLGVSSDDIYRRAERQRKRRQRSWIAGLATVALVLAGLSGWAEISRREAVQQRHRAEMETERATHLLLEVGDENLKKGRLREAFLFYTSSLDLAVDLTEADPDNANWQRILSLSREKLGDWYKSKGDLDLALGSYQASLGIKERVAEAAPSQVYWQHGLSIAYNKIGHVLRAQGKLEEAFASYQEGAAIAKRVVEMIPDSTLYLRGLAGSYDSVGDVLKAQGKLEEALASYRDGLTTRERLAGAEPENVDWQSTLAWSYDSVGDVLKAQGKLEGALKAYKKALTIRDRLAWADSNNMDRQRDLSVSYERVGDVLVAQGDLTAALKSYRDRLNIAKTLVDNDGSNTQWQSDLNYSVERIGGLSYRFVLARDFSKALKASDEAIALAPDKIWLYTNRAHALMFLGRVDEARELYLRYRGTKNVQDDKSWEAVVLNDFAALKKANLTHPLMDEIAESYTADVIQLGPEQPAQAAR